MKIGPLCCISAAMLFSSCATGKEIRLLGSEDIAAALAKNGVANPVSVLKYRQDSDEGAEVFTVEAMSDLKATEFSGCLATMTMLDMRFSGDSWLVENVDSRPQVSLGSCDERDTMGFVDLDGDAHSHELAVALIEMKRLLLDRKTSTGIIFQDETVRAAFGRLKVSDLMAISALQGGKVKLDFVSKGFAPRILQIGITVLEEKVSKIEAYSDTELEVTKP